MVDNENQWEDMEYSDESGDMDDYSAGTISNEEYSDQEYEAYEDEGYEENAAAAQRRGNPLGCLILLLLLLAAIGAGVFMFLNKKGENVDSPKAPNSGIEQTSDNQVNNNDTTAVGDAFFNEAGGENADMMAVDFNASGEATVTTNEGGEEIVATVTDVPSENTDINVTNNEQQSANVEDLFPADLQADPTQGSNEIMVAYNKKTRPNPFKPPVLSRQTDDYALIGGTEFEIIEPPTTSVADENLTRLLQTQISGILYDDVSPSAIVNLNGIDQFVKIGDVISGYKIESITKDRVQITYKNNTYVASVGELFTRGYLEKQQAVADLENKFAGRYRNNN